MVTKTKKDKKSYPQVRTVHVAFSPELMQRIDSRAESESRTRVNMIQVLVKQALDGNQSTAS